MRTSPYPEPPSLTWAGVMAGWYAAVILAALGVLVGIFLLSHPLGVTIILAAWATIALPSAVACLAGVTRQRYRWEWMGSWGVAASTLGYITATVLQLSTVGAVALLTSAPTLFIFIAFVLATLARAVHLSIVDASARRRLAIESAVTGEILEVRADD